MFAYLVYVLFQLVYLYIAMVDTTFQTITNETFRYKLGTKCKVATIYRCGRRTSKKIILFLSGGYQQTYVDYIQKVIIDLLHAISDDEYQYIVFEKLDQSSIDISDDVAAFLNTLDIEELVIMGFSSGGVVASHVMNRLNDRKSITKRKIITYDTPWQIQDNVKSFEKNWFYRIDILFFLVVHSVYSRHADIDLGLVTASRFHGATKMVAMIQTIHGYSDEEMYRVTGWCWDLPSDVIVVNIYTTKDPLVNRTTHERFLLLHRGGATFSIYNLPKNVIGHCSDMAWSTDYLKEVLVALHM